MNIEEAIKTLNELKEIFSSPDPFKDDKDYDRAEAIETLLTAYEEKYKELKKEIQDDLDVRNRWGLTLQELEKEKETSHYIQSQLDIANAKLVEEKEKNKKIEKELEKHIKFCEQEAEGSLNNEICHISLNFNKKLLNILNGEE